ncbi:rhodanese-like domain-containing protein [Phormidium pseudopriestleyi FRX01]|uniref:Rhodanese-like domain-containing protein n=1 Tax=Phormidium pseudopriestleyi FRX01 TaxID=1759528 RepID=A0ABS3FMP9_9CYAN|nr:rhodanese-like domain-containing protein [Phormidium pseudopriestleyi]MBO0348264.1 rhodanese-like domain-containing protein [Phormidium pseudopriestleyi FRX01]
MIKFVKTLFLILFFCLLMGTVAPGPVQAVSTPSNPALSEAIAQFLDDIPGDYYTIMGIPELKRMVDPEKALLIDIRQPSEYASGHILNAINIPLRTLPENIDKIPQNRPVILYCTSGYRTGIGVMTLRLLGYTNVSAFPPSIQGWKASGEPLEK